MAEYRYSPELKKPLAAGDVDFLDPKTQKTLETVMKIFQFQAKMVTAPSRRRIHVSHSGHDGQSFLPACQKLQCSGFPS